MSLSHRRTKWSMVKYDLKTGLDILKLPCLVKVADNTSDIAFDESSTNENTHGCAIKFEKEMCVWFVRARVLDLPDVEWFLRKRGEDFVRSYSLMTDSEILIPLEYGGKVKLFERFGGQKYYSIREVIEDFPRFVRVEKDIVCASPGIKAAQIVEKGTILELDRVTKSMQAIRGSRETFLICKDNTNSRELAFRQMAPVQFTKVSDMTKECLKDFIEHLPLPQTVEFVDVNPYDVISVDDDDARDLLVMFSGEIELLCVQMETFIVGRVENRDTNICDIVAVPTKDNALESFFIHLPVEDHNDKRKTNSCSGGEYIDLTVTDDNIYSCLQRKLFLRYADDDSPLFLRTDNSDSLKYEFEDMPDTPPIPERLDEYMLKHTLSESNCGPDQERSKERHVRRKRFLSANDIERNSAPQRTDRQHSLKPFLSQLSRRMKSTASHLLFGIEAFSGAVDQDIENGGKISSANEKDTFDVSTSKRSGFVCYLGFDHKNVQSVEPSQNFDDTDCRDTRSAKNEEVVYACVDVLRKKQNKSGIQYRNSCAICREILKKDLN